MSKFGYFDPNTTFLSGGAGSGALADGSVLSGTIASGQVGWPHLASGAVRSGHVANAAVNSGNIASGSIGSVHIQDGTIITVDIASGAVASGEIASGSVPGFFGTTRVIQSGTLGNFDFGSGAVIAGTMASGAVQSGNLSSGVVGDMHLASGAVKSGHVGNNAVNSGNIASGSIGLNHLASGTTIDAARWLQDDFYVTSEIVSGGRWVATNLSGNGVWVAQAGLGASGRMPAFGFMPGNALSGVAGFIVTQGRVFDPLFALSGNFTSGFINQNAYVGLSGETVSASGLSGITAFPLSGYVAQAVGIVQSASGIFVRPL